MLMDHLISPKETIDQQMAKVSTFKLNADEARNLSEKPIEQIEQNLVPAVKRVAPATKQRATVKQIKRVAQVSTMPNQKPGANQDWEEF